LNRMPVVISIIMLLLALPSGWPYGYYQILRFVVCGTSAYMAYQCYTDKNQKWTWLLGVIAVLFNPILPIHMDKESWAVIDVIVAAIFTIFLIKFKKKRTGKLR